jgi:hypothetical protein
VAIRVPELKQQSRIDCLTTAALAVLSLSKRTVTRTEVAEWCGQNGQGCFLEFAIDGLRQAGFDVEDLTGETPATIRETVTDPDNPLPVIVTLLDPDWISDADHAVVITDVRHELRYGILVEVVEYMDPWFGAYRMDATGQFWWHWNFGGSHAFAIDPG